MYTQQTVINDALNLLRGKLVRFILEDGDMRMIANLVAAADELGLEYDPEGMVYRLPEQEKEGMTRKQLAAALEPGLNALFGANYSPERKTKDQLLEEVFNAPEKSLEEENREAFEHAWAREHRKVLKEKQEKEKARLERKSESAGVLSRKEEQKAETRTPKKGGKVNASKSKPRR